MKYKFLEEVAIADIAYEAYGKDLTELFTNSAEALFETMAQIKTVEPLEKHKIALESGKTEDLLYDFLSEIVYIKDRDSIVFRESDLEVKEAEGKFYLTATIFGEPINEKKQTLGADVKAITLHMFKIEKTDQGYKSTVVLDI